MISVVIPVGFKNRDLVGCIRSAMRFSKITEIIVVVDNPDVSLPEIHTNIAKLNSKVDVKVIRNKLATGANNARMTGILASLNNWIAFLDDDDELLPDFQSSISIASNAIGHPTVVIVGDYIYGQVPVPIPDSIEKIYETINNSLCLVPFSGMLAYKSPLLLKCFPADLPSWQDDYLIIKHMLFGKIEKANGAVARLNYSSQSISTNKVKKLGGLRYIRRELCDMLGENRFRRFLWRMREFILYLEVKSDASRISLVSVLLNNVARAVRKLIGVFFHRMGA